MVWKKKLSVFLDNKNKQKSYIFSIIFILSVALIYNNVITPRIKYPEYCYVIEKSDYYELNLEHTNFNSKITILVPLNSSCFNCFLDNYINWDALRKSTPSLQNAQIIFIIDGGIDLFDSFLYRYTDIVFNSYLIELSEIQNCNKLSKNKFNKTLLIGNDNRIKILGSPIRNEHILKDYLRYLNSDKDKFY